MKILQQIPLLSAAVLLGGCATQISTTIVNNPPPSEKFAAFTRFELRPVTLAPAYADHSANRRALAKIEENISAKMQPTLARWSNGHKGSANARTLVIEPTVTEIKFINGNARFWVGPIAGSSAVVLQVRIFEKETEKVVASPVFYARSAAMGGTFSIGATDNLMLVRIAGRLTDYLMANYDNAVGGPSGSGPDRP